MHPELEAICLHRNSTSVDALITTLPAGSCQVKVTITQKQCHKLSIYFLQATDFSA